MSTPTWSAPLPDLTNPAVDVRFNIGPHAFRLLISPVLREIPGEPDTDLVQLMVLLNGKPVTLHDLGAGPAVASGLWSYLCSKITELAVDFYDPRPRPEGELNPRLGCWGTRPDLLDVSRDDDSTLAAVVGVSIWAVGARPRGSDADLLRELAQTVTEVMAYWIVSIERERRKRAGLQ